MSTPFFEISENEGVVELIVSGDLTVGKAIFRSYLLKLLEHGKSKSYKLNLAGASAIDTASVRLICTLRRELTMAETPLTIELPNEPGIRAHFDQRFVSKVLF